MAETLKQWEKRAQRFVEKWKEDQFADRDGHYGTPSLLVAIMRWLPKNPKPVDVEAEAQRLFAKHDISSAFSSPMVKQPSLPWPDAAMRAEVTTAYHVRVRVANMRRPDEEARIDLLGQEIAATVTLKQAEIDLWRKTRRVGDERSRGEMQGWKVSPDPIPNVPQGLFDLGDPEV